MGCFSGPEPAIVEDGAEANSRSDLATFFFVAEFVPKLLVSRVFGHGEKIDFFASPQYFGRGRLPAHSCCFLQRTFSGSGRAAGIQQGPWGGHRLSVPPQF